MHNSDQNVKYSRLSKYELILSFQSYLDQSSSIRTRAKEEAMVIGDERGFPTIAYVQLCQAFAAEIRARYSCPMRSSHRVLAVCAALVLLISSLQFLLKDGIERAEASSSSSFSSSSMSIGPVCGNSICEFPSESCDGGDYCGASCGSFGFTNGVVTCSLGCVIDTSGCYNGSSSSISSSSSSVGSSSSVSAPFFSWWSLLLLLAACVGGWKLMSAEKRD